MSEQVDETVQPSADISEPHDEDSFVILPDPEDEFASSKPEIDTVSFEEMGDYSDADWSTEE